MKSIFLFLLIFTVVVSAANAASIVSVINAEGLPLSNGQGVVLGKQVEVMPQGEYATIKTGKDISVMNALKSSKRFTVQNGMEKVLNHPGDYAPPVLCVVSSVLVKQHEMKKAAFWYAACLLRAISDANKTKDPSSRAAVPTLVNNFYTNYDIDITNEIINQVIKWDKVTPRNYDPRWIMLYGLGSFSDDKFDFAPKSKWKAINKNTREEFQKGWCSDN